MTENQLSDLEQEFIRCVRLRIIENVSISITDCKEESYKERRRLQIVYWDKFCVSEVLPIELAPLLNDEIKMQGFMKNVNEIRHTHLMKIEV